jgi:hypothetical protein
MSVYAQRRVSKFAVVPGFSLSHPAHFFNFISCSLPSCFLGSILFPSSFLLSVLTSDLLYSYLPFRSQKMSLYSSHRHTFSFSSFIVHMQLCDYMLIYGILFVVFFSLDCKHYKDRYLVIVLLFYIKYLLECLTHNKCCRSVY